MHLLFFACLFVFYTTATFMLLDWLKKRREVREEEQWSAALSRLDGAQEFAVPRLTYATDKDAPTVDELPKGATGCVSTEESKSQNVANAPARSRFASVNSLWTPLD